MDVGGSKHRGIGNTCDVGASVFLAGGTIATTQASGTSRASNVGDIGAIVDVARADIKVKGGIGTGDLQAFILIVEERGVLEGEVGECKFIGVRVNWVTTLYTLEMGNVGGNEIQREVIHAFIKLSMIGNLDTLRFDIIPE